MQERERIKVATQSALFVLVVLLGLCFFFREPIQTVLSGPSASPQKMSAPPTESVSPE